MPSQTVDPSQPPVGVGGYTDAKPQQQYNPDPYANQNAFQAQQQQAVPASQYNTHHPQQDLYANDVKTGYAAPGNGAAELAGGEDSTASAGVPNATQAVELGGGDNREGASELPGNSKTQ
jgi:hypothetical protein